MSRDWSHPAIMESPGSFFVIGICKLGRRYLTPAGEVKSWFLTSVSLPPTLVSTHLSFVSGSAGVRNVPLVGAPEPGWLGGLSGLESLLSRPPNITQ